MSSQEHDTTTASKHEYTPNFSLSGGKSVYTKQYNLEIYSTVLFFFSVTSKDSSLITRFLSHSRDILHQNFNLKQIILFITPFLSKKVMILLLIIHH